MLTSLARTGITRPLSRSLHTTATRTMPLYLCYCPDYPNNLETRLKARQAHLAAATEDKKTGKSGECLATQKGQVCSLSESCLCGSLTPVCNGARDVVLAERNGQHSRGLWQPSTLQRA